MKFLRYTAISAVVIVGCGQKTSSSDPETLLAADKNKLFETLKRVDSAGTANEVFASAAADSSLRDKMEEALGMKQRHAEARPQKGPKKDVLDKSADALDVANEKVTKSGVVLDKASEVKKKTTDILSK
ncbi:MAG: hypothetical protein JSS75_04305 [Bacteroidetes bacterium]|nr:hypothetical protein [Bacteroidota bacterium]